MSFTNSYTYWQNLNYIYCYLWFKIILFLLAPSHRWILSKSWGFRQLLESRTRQLTFHLMVPKITAKIEQNHALYKMITLWSSDFEHLASYQPSIWFLVKELNSIFNLIILRAIDSLNLNSYRNFRCTIYSAPNYIMKKIEIQK